MGIIEQYGHGLEIPKDELTAIERDRLLSEGKEVDRIMCCIDTGETPALASLDEVDKAKLVDVDKDARLLWTHRQRTCRLLWMQRAYSEDTRSIRSF